MSHAFRWRHHRATRLIKHYINYRCTVKNLCAINKPKLRQLRSQYPEEYPYDIHIVDKLLWMVCTSWWTVVGARYALYIRPIDDSCLAHYGASRLAEWPSVRHDGLQALNAAPSAMA